MKQTWLNCGEVTAQFCLGGLELLASVPRSVGALLVERHNQRGHNTHQKHGNPEVSFLLASADAVEDEAEHGKAKPEPVHYGVLSWGELRRENARLCEEVS